HPAARVCAGHRAAQCRRRAWFRRCRALGCPHVETVTGVTPPVYTCRQPACTRRRWPWVRRSAPAQPARETRP
ncbi:MAG: hypothetical protein KJ734_05105, partial [Chloroflexi bacterium]|nr:hypothetical protein [Chloroflexota bacterium]